MFIVIMLWAASIDGHLSSLVACHCTDLYLFNLFVPLANKLSLSLHWKAYPQYNCNADVLSLQQQLTRNSSGDEIANVNFLYDDIVHVLQNAIDSCINSATDRCGYVLERMCLPNSVK